MSNHDTPTEYIPDADHAIRNLTRHGRTVRPGGDERTV